MIPNGAGARCTTYQSPVTFRRLRTEAARNPSPRYHSPADERHDVPRPSAAIPKASGALSRIAAVVRRIIGVPDYQIYLEHMQRCHPDRQPISKDVFDQQRMDARYNTPGSRCC